MEKNSKDLENVSGGWVGTDRSMYGEIKGYSVYDDKTGRKLNTFKDCDKAIEFDEKHN